MTIKEAVLAFCSVEVSDKTVDLEIINKYLNPDTDYVASMEKDVAYVALSVLSSLYIVNTFKEGDLTIQYDREGIKQRILFLANKYGLPEFIDQFKPKVVDKSYLW